MIGLYEDDVEIAREEILHDPYELSHIADAAGQCAYRLRALEGFLSARTGPGERKIDAVIGMAYIAAPMPTGIYVINGEFMRHVWKTRQDRHQHDMGALMAASVAHRRRADAYAMITFSSDEFDCIARMSGMPSLLFGKMTYALYIRNAVSMAARDLGDVSGDASFVIAHLGRSFSICAYSGGRIRDMTITFERGPFSQVRSGGMPAAEIVRMAYSGMWSKTDLLERLNALGGLMSYVGTDDLPEMMSRVADGDEYAGMIAKGMIYQTASEIASMAATLSGAVDAIVLEGICTSDGMFVEMLKERISWITDRILVYRGDDELVSLAKSALEVLRGQDPAFRYTYSPAK
jgi:butyrate kinase